METVMPGLGAILSGLGAGLGSLPFGGSAANERQIDLGWMAEQMRNVADDPDCLLRQAEMMRPMRPMTASGAPIVADAEARPVT